MLVAEECVDEHMDDGHADDEQSPGLWSFVAILLGFKLWTLLLILLFATSWATVRFLIATHVLWISIGAVVLWGPAILWFRLIRARARRRELQRAEWHVEDTQPTRR